MKQKRKKVLAVDDNNSNLRVYERILDDLDIDVIKAKSGEKALELAFEEKFFLILMDVQMPGMDGFETASLLLDHPNTKNTPIIFITAISKEENFMLKGYKSGAVDYMVKPINDDILRSKVKIFLELELKNNKIVELERKLTLDATNVSLNHYINQHLMIISGNIDLIELFIKDDKDYEKKLPKIKKVKNSIKEISNILSKINDLDEVNFKNYIDDVKMLDLDL